MVSLPGYARKEFEWLMERAHRPRKTHEYYTDIHTVLSIIHPLFEKIITVVLPDGLDGVLRRVLRSFMSFILWI